MLLDVEHRILLHPLQTDFKMHMDACLPINTASVPHGGNLVPPLHRTPYIHKNVLVVSVERHKTIPVINLHYVPVPPVPAVICAENNTCLCRIDIASATFLQIHCVVTRVVVLC